MASSKRTSLKDRLLLWLGLDRAAQSSPRNHTATILRPVGRGFGWHAPSRPSSKVADQIKTLQSEQIRLSAEVERTLAFYDDRTRALAKRLAGEGGRIDSRTLERIRAEQAELWRTVRRLQAALRVTRDLETELKDWAGHKEADDVIGTDGRDRRTIGHPDHPATRIEIVASELRARGRDPLAYLQSIRPRRFEGSAGDVDPLEEIEQGGGMMDEGGEMDRPPSSPPPSSFRMARRRS